MESATKNYELDERRANPFGRSSMSSNGLLIVRRRISEAARRGYSGQSLPEDERSLRIGIDAAGFMARHDVATVGLDPLGEPG